jgi:hypothetical protein
MRVLSLGGAGAVCQHATRDLAEFSDFEQIVIGDYNLAAAEALAASIGDPRVAAIQVNAEDYDGLVRTFWLSPGPASRPASTVWTYLQRRINGTMTPQQKRRASSLFPGWEPPRESPMPWPGGVQTNWTRWTTFRSTLPPFAVRRPRPAC